jgi:hypothetical protein
MDEFENYWKLSDMEQRFNSSSAGIRTLSSAWILGALAALGWLLEPARAALRWDLPVGLLAGSVCALATAGIATLWVLDQLVFHRLLNSVFLVGLRMEAANPSLPPLRSMMMKTMEGEGSHRWERLFYLAPLLVFTLLAATLLWAAPEPVARAAAADWRPIGLLLLGCQVAIVAWVLFKQPGMSVIDRAKWFGDPAFTDCVQARAFERIIERWQPAPATSPRDASSDPVGASATT